MATELKLPEVGENIEKASIVRVLVAEGDTVEKNQGVLEIETDKATVEVPANVGGKIISIKVKAGEDVRVGQVVLTIDGVAGDGATAKPAAKEPAKPAAAASAKTTTIAPAAPKAATPPAPSPQPAPATRLPGARPLTDRPVPAAPSVRRLAREIGVFIAEVQGSGPGGRITMDDVKAHAKRQADAARAGGGAAGPAAPPMPDFAQWGEIERQPMTNIRKVIAERMSYAWLTVAHVHQHDKADVTELEQIRKQSNARAEKAGGDAPKLTMTAILIKVVASLLKRYPQFNASLDAGKQELVVKKYFNIGVAVDTPRGLVVPVIRDADHKSVVELAGELGAAAARARDGKMTLDDMKGGTFTISNLGGIGGTSFNPIVNWPEVAILGVARTQKELVLEGGKPVERLMMPLCLAYDHRVIDGADGARFIADLSRILSNPHELLFDF
jgi:pyruvate dehydrogenase E2 component (dihydrolipoamide acetyltransferase)